MATPLIQNRYKLTRRLGHGGFGTVYQAQDTRLGRIVALKELFADQLEPGNSAVAAQLFEREAQMLAQLDHPNLTNIWDYFQEGDRSFLVMEYVPGPTLGQLVQEHGGPLPEPFVVACALQLCDVLHYLHTRTPPVIFRDLKPANVIAEAEGDAADLLRANPQTLRFKLIDFGIARFFKPNQTGDTMIIGTPGYAPPEQYGQGQTDERSDIYGLGTTLHHLLSGATPGVAVLPLERVAPHVAPALLAIISRATQFDRGARYADVAAMRRDLLALVQPVTPRLAPQPVTRPAVLRAPTPNATVVLPNTRAVPASPPRRRWPLIGVTLLALLALGAFAVGRLRGTNANEQATLPNVPPVTTPAAEGEWRLADAPGRIAFGQLNQTGGFYDLALATLDGTLQPVASDGKNFSPAISPDGRRVAFARVVVNEQKSAILVSTLGLSTVEQVVAPDAYARYPAWSPDGKQLAFGSAPNRQGNFKLAVVNIQNGQTRLVGPERVAWIAWSPQNALTYSAPPVSGQAQDVFVLQEDGTPLNLTNTPALEEDFPAWSPDGRRVAFVRSPAGQQNLNQRQIYVMNADGGGATQLTRGAGPFTNPVWSPDGRWIAYLSRAGGGDWQVWAMRADGGEPRQLTFSPQQKFFLSWGR